MATYRVPEDVGDQTRVLVKAGVARLVLAALHHERLAREGATVTLEQCMFWARTARDVDGIPGLHLQVVASYPRPGAPHVRVGWGVTVASVGVSEILPTPGAYARLSAAEAAEHPWWLPGCGGDGLTSDQLRTVARLAEGGGGE